MDLKNKLKGLPTVYYLNLDNRIDRKEYMENQFDYWNIKYKRFSGSNYLASEYDSWKHLIINYQNINMIPMCLGCLMSHLDMIEEWLNTNEEYMIMMEDDYDLNLIEYWHFDWNYLMNNIPYDWDCIQIGFESRSLIHFFLHPKLRHTYHGACMINRDYAKKLLKLHKQNNQYKFDNIIADYDFIHGFPGPATVDYAITKPGKTYCLPLICINTELKSFEDYTERNYPPQKFARKVFYDWWQNERDNFTLEDFFTYGKPYDHRMTKRVTSNIVGIL